MSTIVKSVCKECGKEFSYGGRRLASRVEAGHFLPSGEPGVYGRGQIFEQMRNRFDALVNSYSEQDSPEMPRFPPLIPKRTLERAGYLKSFPHLCGAVFSFAGKEMQAMELLETAGKGEDWSRSSP